MNDHHQELLCPLPFGHDVAGLDLKSPPLPAGTAECLRWSSQGPAAFLKKTSTPPTDYQIKIIHPL